MTSTEPTTLRRYAPLVPRAIWFTLPTRGSGRVARVDSVNFDRAAEHYDATRALPAESMTGLTGLTGLLAAELAALAGGH
jgi:hypothetical protein